MQETQDKNMCSGCQLPITDRYLLEALGRYWHEGCLKCNCCECKLGDIGSTLYSKANLILCKRDYLRLVKLAVVYLRASGLLAYLRKYIENRIPHCVFQTSS